MTGLDTHKNSELIARHVPWQKIKVQDPQGPASRTYTFHDPGFPRSHVKYTFQDPGFSRSHVKYTFQDPGFPRSHVQYTYISGSRVPRSYVRYTGWSINNRTNLNCSHFLDRRYFFQSVFTQGEYTHWQIITATLVRHDIICYSGLVSHCFTLQLGGSANSVLWRGRHFWKNRQSKRALNFCKFGLNRKKLSQ